MEPKFVGAVEIIVNIGDSFDYDALYREKEKVIGLTKQNTALHRRATRFLSAAGSLINDTYRLAMDATDTEKVVRYARRLTNREISKKPDCVSRESERFISAVTPEGLLWFEDTVFSQCERVFAVDDEYGAVSRIFMATVRAAALDAGVDITSCCCPFSPADKVEHIIIPELRLGFITSNRRHKPETKPFRTVHAARFTDSVSLKVHRERVLFNKKAVGELLGEAVSAMKDAKSIHDKLEKCYIPNVDFRIIDEKTEQLIRRISKNNIGFSPLP